MFFGYLGLVDGILERMIAEFAAAGGRQPTVVATGGLAQLIAPESRFIMEVDEMLTLSGLRLIHERNERSERNEERKPEARRPGAGS